MITDHQSLRFGKNVVAVLIATIIGSTVFSTGEVIWIIVASASRVPGFSWLATLALLWWIGVFALAFPSAGIILSLLWPIIRKRTLATHLLCLTAGGAVGVFLAPLASPHMHGTSTFQLGVFLATGMMIAAIYLASLAAFSRSAKAGATLQLTSTFD